MEGRERKDTPPPRSRWRMTQRHDAYQHRESAGHKGAETALGIFPSQVFY